MMMSSHYLLVPAFFGTALLYSLAGFGGGSTYLALLALAGVSYNLMPVTALVCNIIVVLGGCLVFFKERHFDFKLVVPFLFTSVPFSYVGGRILIAKEAFFILLGFTLLVASLRLFLMDEKFSDAEQVQWKKSLLVGLPVGAVLGFVSGLTGIGGGIFLSPILYVLRWGRAKSVAAASSLFILVNSLAGLWGQFSKNPFQMNWELLFPLALAVFLGGQIGSRLSAQKISQIMVKRWAAVLILSVSVKILWQSMLY